MSQRKKRHGLRLQVALARAHDRLHGAEYELGLSRRANEALSSRSAQERAKARDMQSDMAEQIGMLRRYLGDVERMVGQYSMAAGDPQFVRAPGTRYPKDYSLPMFHIDSFRGLDNAATAMAINHSRRIVMRLLEVKAVRDRVREMTHLRVSLGDQSAGYYLSDAAIYEAPLEVVIPRVSDELATMLLTEIRKGTERTRYDTFADMERPPLPPARWQFRR